MICVPGSQRFQQSGNKQRHEVRAFEFCSALAQRLASLSVLDGRADGGAA
jgi:hypothetical protein